MDGAPGRQVVNNLSRCDRNTSEVWPSGVACSSSPSACPAPPQAPPTGGPGRGGGDLPVPCTLCVWQAQLGTSCCPLGGSRGVDRKQYLARSLKSWVQVLTPSQARALSPRLSSAVV